MKRPHPSAPHIAFFVALAAGLALAQKGPPAQDDPTVAIVDALRARGLSAAPTDLRWVDAPQGIRGALSARRRALVRAIPAPGEPHDLYLVEARLAPNGAFLGLGGSYNLTETSSADEELPVVRGEHA